VTRSAAVVLLALAAGCRPGAEAPEGGAAVPGAHPEASSLVEQGRYDEALVALEQPADAEAFYLVGRAWLGKSRTAPLPTTAPGAAAAGATAMKDEERRALDAFERATALEPTHAGAHLAIAELLGPHALGRVAEERAAAERARRSRRRPSPVAPPVAGPEASVERVLREYAAAVQADPAGRQAVESLIAFARSAGRLEEASAAFQELIRRDRENPELLVRYGDFLAGEMRQPDAALAQYAQALIWRSDDEATKLKMADIHLDAAEGHLGRQEWASAQARLRDARRYVVVPGSRQAARLRELESHLAQIRGLPPPR
jgi:tetratricopeptide (TPR) repeat protein